MEDGDHFVDSGLPPGAPAPVPGLVTRYSYIYQYIVESSRLAGGSGGCEYPVQARQVVTESSGTGSGGSGTPGAAGSGKRHRRCAWPPGRSALPAHCVNVRGQDTMRTNEHRQCLRIPLPALQRTVTRRHAAKPGSDNRCPVLLHFSWTGTTRTSNTIPREDPDDHGCLCKNPIIIGFCAILLQTAATPVCLFLSRRDHCVTARLAVNRDMFETDNRQHRT